MLAKQNKNFPRVWNVLAYFEQREREALVLEEAGHELDQIVKSLGGKVGKLPEFIPQAELEGHLWKMEAGEKKKKVSKPMRGNLTSSRAKSKRSQRGSLRGTSRAEEEALLLVVGVWVVCS